MAYSRDSSGSRWRRRKKFWCHLSHVRMPCIFIGCLIDQGQLDSHNCRTQWGICLARRKISNMFDFFLTASRGEFPHQKFPAYVRKRLSKPPREAVCSALSSPCAAGLMLKTSHKSFLWCLIDKSNVFQFCLYSYRHWYWSSQGSKCCGLTCCSWMNQQQILTTVLSQWISLSIRVQTMLNYIRFVFYHIIQPHVYLEVDHDCDTKKEQGLSITFL